MSSQVLTVEVFRCYQPRLLRRQKGEEGEELPCPNPIFRVVDGGERHLYVQQCVCQSGLKFMKDIPKIGSCFMCRLSASESQSDVRAVLICDTLSPPGNGAPISQVHMRLLRPHEYCLLQDDQSFVLHLADVLSSLMQQLHAESSHTEEESSEWLEKLKATVSDIRNQTADKADAPVEEEAEIENVADDTDDEQKALAAEMAELSEEIKTAKADVKQSTTALETEEQIFDAVKHSIKTEKDQILTQLGKQLQPPSQTIALLRLILSLLGKRQFRPALSSALLAGMKDVATEKSSWSSMRPRILEELFPAMDAFCTKDTAHFGSWTALRASLNAYRQENHSAPSVLHSALLLFLKQVRLNHASHFIDIICPLRSAAWRKHTANYSPQNHPFQTRKHLWNSRKLLLLEFLPTLLMHQKEKQMADWTSRLCV